jgi:predicted HTH domain antitoxin
MRAASGSNWNADGTASGAASYDEYAGIDRRWLRPLEKEDEMSETVYLSVEFPKSFVEELWADEVHASVALKEAGVLELFRQGQISIRKAAELLGLSYRGFLELARHQISLVNYEEGWIDQELEILDKVKKQAI